MISNTASTADKGYGGGMEIVQSDAVISGNVISGNLASDAQYGYGGGLDLDHSDATLESNVICNNLATSSGYGEGGGICLYSSDAVLKNDIIAGNSLGFAGKGAGAFAQLASHPRFLHVTIAHNGGGDGSGLHVACWGSDCSSVAMTNTVLVSHTVGITVVAGSSVTLNSTLWLPSDAKKSGPGTINSVNEYTGDPAFVCQGDDCYHIGPGSAALDRGIDAGVDSDIDGDRRPQALAPDPGADEHDFGFDINLPLVVKSFS